MKSILLKEIVKTIHGEFYGDVDKLDQVYITNIKIDSRDDLIDCLFIALKGKNFDGHNYIAQALSKGAACIVTEQYLNIKQSFIKVESTYKALSDLARYYINLFDVNVIAITGSTGKTTTKDMIACVLSQEFSVIKTIGNFNNNVGVPLSIFQIDSNTEIAVLELGMNHAGEINVLSKLTKPHICVITNIGTSHIGYFTNQEEIFKAKCEIFNHAKKNFITVINGDDKYLKTLKLDNQICVGLDKSNDVFAYDIHNDSFKCNITNCVFKLKQHADFMIRNSMMAIAIGKYFGIQSNKIKFALENFQSNRMVFIKLKNNLTLIDDTYNASPDSMQASIKILNDMNIQYKKVCILGDMLELGEKSEELHREIGDYISTCKIDSVICIGDFIRYTYKNINGIPEKFLFRTIEDFMNLFDTKEWHDTFVLIKASHAIGFKNIVNKFQTKFM